MEPAVQAVFRFPPGRPGATVLLQFPALSGDTEMA